MRVHERDVGRLRRETWKALVSKTVDEVSQRAKDAASARDDSNKRHRDDDPDCSTSNLKGEMHTSRAAVRALQRLEQQEMMLVKTLLATRLRTPRKYGFVWHLHLRSTRSMQPPGCPRIAGFHRSAFLSCRLSRSKFAYAHCIRGVPCYSVGFSSFCDV